MKCLNFKNSFVHDNFIQNTSYPSSILGISNVNELSLAFSHYNFKFLPSASLEIHHQSQATLLASIIGKHALFTKFEFSNCQQQKARWGTCMR